MTRTIRAALLAASLLTAAAARADTLPLKRVVVTTSGLALYDYEGDVKDNATLDFPVRLDRVDDVLKSLVVLDAKGTPGGVTLPGREPLAQLFGGLPFAQDDLASQPQLLNALRGASVRVTGSDFTAEGRLLGVADEPEQTKDGGTVTRHRVSVATDTGLRSALLEDGISVAFTDKALQAQLDHALSLVFNSGNDGQRTLHVALHGDGTRPVGVSFIEQAPLWKTTYRLVIPADDDKSTQAMLQGWAILENTTGQDWQGVGVTLMSGAPVTYHQALYDSYYPPRNELPLKVMGLILPKPDDGTVAAALKKASDEPDADKASADDDAAPAPPAPIAAPVMMRAPMMMRAMGRVSAYASPAGMPVAAAPAATASEMAAQLLFAFPQPVDLPAGNSLMVPFINRTLPAEKVWVYQPASDASVEPLARRPGSPDHPYAAIVIRNDGESGLPPGILTLYGQNPNGLLFVGDADMPLVPKGESRFIPFALDNKTNIDREAQDDRTLGVITISKGMLNQKIVETNTTIYTLKAPADESRTIVIEHPRRDGWQLQKPDGLAADPEMTSDAYRLRITLDPGQGKTIRAIMTRTSDEAVALSSADPQDLDARMEAAGQQLPATIRAALGKVKTLQQAVADQQKTLADIAQRRQTFVEDQSRLRDNLKAVEADNALGKRYLKTLDDEETQLDALAKQEQDARDKLATAQKALNDYVSTLTI